MILKKLDDKKKHEVLDFFNAPSVMFLEYQKKLFVMVFLVFFDKGTPYFNCIKADDFRWYKITKNLLYTFYLKHLKYSFCAPIFHPLSETESYIGVQVCI